MRWDEDVRGTGIADAAAFAPGAEELVAAMRTDGWVAEEAEAHLLSHVRRACEKSRLELVDASQGEDGVFVVRLRWRGPRDVRSVRGAIFALVGAVAESATYVRQRREGERDIDDASASTIEYEVVTGMLAPDTEFAPHGHTLRLRVSL